jgi:ATP-dependent Clp protease ATP-binding subunit ClpC
MTSEPFERFTERCHRLVAMAAEEARRRRNDYVGTEHLLLALAKHGEGVAATMLRNRLGELIWVRAEVECLIATGSAAAASSFPLPLSPIAQRALQLATEEARAMGVLETGTEHLLLGLLGESDGVAARALNKLGLRYREVQASIVHILETGADPIIERAG